MAGSGSKESRVKTLMLGLFLCLDFTLVTLLLNQPLCRVRASVEIIQSFSFLTGEERSRESSEKN